MSKDAKTALVLFAIMILILSSETVDLFRTYHGGHLAIRIILNIVLLVLFGASLVPWKKKSN
jgi:hypothetical protein